MAEATASVDASVYKSDTDTPQAVTLQSPKKRSQGGAPFGNENAIKSGLRGSKLPKGCKGEEHELYALRREVLGELTAAVGGLEKIPLLSLALLQSLIRHETRARLAARWLRIGGDTMPLADRLALLTTISGATDARDKCLEKMGLTVEKQRENFLGLTLEDVIQPPKPSQPEPPAPPPPTPPAPKQA